VAHSQSILTVDITESYFFSTSSPTTAAGSFIQDVSVVLREIKDCCSENTTKFATITVIVPSTVYADDPTTVISLSSVVGQHRVITDTTNWKNVPVHELLLG